jgi:hypothetical protein
VFANSSRPNLGFIIFCSKLIRPLSKLALTNKVQGVYGAEDRNVLEVHEDLSTGATQQFDDGVEFGKRSISLLQHFYFLLSNVKSNVN